MSCKTVVWCITGTVNYLQILLTIRTMLAVFVDSFRHAELYDIAMQPHLDEFILLIKFFIDQQIVPLCSVKLRSWQILAHWQKLMFRPYALHAWKFDECLQPNPNTIGLRWIVWQYFIFPRCRNCKLSESTKDTWYHFSVKQLQNDVQ